MIELGPDNVVAWLREAGRLGRDTPAEAQALAWGVSNVVLRIRTADGDEFVLKQSRQRLRTQAEWISRLDRIWREADVMRALAPLLPEGVIPRILFEDRGNYLFAMQAAPADHVVWKAELLGGTADPLIADTLGTYLATIHRATAGDERLRAAFGDCEVFDQLRIDPFYRRIAQAHPDLRPAVGRLIDETFATRLCVVHADFSPKNVLLARPGITLVDFETGHYGDPAFDLGFFLSHLLLKTVLHAPQWERFLALASTFLESYRARGAGLQPALERGAGLQPALERGAGLQPALESPRAGQVTNLPHAGDLDRRSVGHLAACMLARIDGKSPVDYLDPERQEFVRQFSRQLLLEPPDGLDGALNRLQERLPRPD